MSKTSDNSIPILKVHISGITITSPSVNIKNSLRLIDLSSSYIYILLATLMMGQLFLSAH